MICTGVNFKRDLIFEDLVFNQCEGGAAAVGYRGHEVSDKDTKQALRAVATLESNRQWQDICVMMVFLRLWDVVEDAWNEESFFWPS